MNEKQKALNQKLKSALTELDRLAEQIRQTRDFSDQAEHVLCLRELVLEQIEAKSENTSYPNHQAR